MNQPPFRPGNSSARNNSHRRRRRRSPRRDRGPGNPLDELVLKIPDDKSVVIGITGEPGSGKSALGKELQKLGAEILDVDELGHQVIDGPATRKKLVEAFGEEILGEDGKIARADLAAKAFSSADTATTLNKIVHPQLSRKVKMALKKTGNFVVIDAALLHELGLNERCDTTVYVRSPYAARLERVGRRGWDEAELQRREAALGNANQRSQVCDVIVENTGDTALLATYAKTVLARLLGIDPLAKRKDKETDESELDDNEEGVDATETLTPAIIEEVMPPEPDPVVADMNEYLARSLTSLQDEGEKLEVRDVRALGKHELINEILRRVASNRQDSIVADGFLEQHKDSSGYLRHPLNHYHVCPTDPFVNNQLLRRFGLKPGMHIRGIARAPRGNERCPQMLQITEIMGTDASVRTSYPRFEDLIPLHAEQRLFMERHDKPGDFNLRIIDLIAPIGKGQRGLIVAQPKAGKTVYLQKIANAITTNNPEVKLMVLLVDERPEEVTDMERSVDGEVIASTFDQHSSRHVQIAELVITKAKRMVERGEDVVILLDSITRLARAYNSEAPSSGRIMSGGLESGALIKPKQFFGAARNIENGGSLTILGTTLVDTGSVMDTVIFEEFKGTGNMELVLDRRLANKGIYPALDVALSGTRRDDLIITNGEELIRVQALRRFLVDRSSQDAVEFLKSQLKNHKTNVEFLMSIDPTRNQIMS
jgi:transcription termination factor Rho